MSVDALIKYLEKVKEEGKEQRVEEVDSYLIIPISKKKVKEDFIMVFQKSMIKLAGMDLTLYEWKVLAFLLGITDFQNLILITQREIATYTGIKQSHVSETLKSLAEKGLITKKKKGRQNAYSIDPELAWKGKEVNRQELMKIRKNKNRGTRM